MKQPSTNDHSLEKLGSWIQQERKRRDLDIRAFAQDVGMHPSSISRFERGAAKPKLLSLLRICQGLHIRFERLLYEVYERNAVVISLRSDGLYAGGDQLSITDLEQLVARLRRDPNRTLTGLRLAVAELLDRVPTVKGAFPDFEQVETDLIVHTAAHWQISYPSVNMYTIVHDLYQQGSPLTLRDVGAYFTQQRQRKDLTLRAIESETQVSDTGLMRIEQGSVENVLIRDLFKVADALQNPHLIGMYINALELYLRTVRPDVRNPEREVQAGKWRPEELMLTIRFVWLCRWFQLSVPEWQQRICQHIDLHVKQ